MTQRYPVAVKDQYVTQSTLDLRVPVGAVDSLGQRITDEKWRRPATLNATNDLDVMVGRQWEGLHSAATATAGLPVQRPGWVSIIYNGADARTEQEFWSPTEKARFVRYHAGGAWSEWETPLVTQSTLDLRVPVGAIPGQLLMATATGGKWSWADKHPINYYNTY